MITVMGCMGVEDTSVDDKGDVVLIRSKGAGKSEHILGFREVEALVKKTLNIGIDGSPSSGGGYGGVENGEDAGWRGVKGNNHWSFLRTKSRAHGRN